MNENTNTTVTTDPVELLANSDPAETVVEDPAENTEALEQEMESTGDTVQTIEVIQVMVEERPFLTTDFMDYTVSEGLLLMILVSMIVKFCIGLVKEGFSWLFS